MSRGNALYRALRSDIQNNRNEILDQFNNSCEVCGLDVKEFLEIHHLLPISKGGNNDIYNLSVLCPTCHKALHIWLDQDNGSDVINLHYITRISHEEYRRLVNLLRRSVKLNNERVKKFNEFYERTRREHAYE